MPLRTLVILLTGLALLVATSSGLNRGMMLQVDAGGHFYWENAHALHAASHAADGHHQHHSPPTDEHADLHTAICFSLDGGPAKTQTNGAAHAAAHAQPDLPLPFATTAVAALPALPGAAGMGRLSGPGTPARAELTCLTAIILLV